MYEEKQQTILPRKSEIKHDKYTKKHEEKGLITRSRED